MTQTHHSVYNRLLQRYQYQTFFENLDIDNNNILYNISIIEIYSILLNTL